MYVQMICEASRVEGVARGVVDDQMKNELSLWKRCKLSDGRELIKCVTYEHTSA